MLDKIRSAIDGNKSYLVLAGIAVLIAIRGSGGGALDLNSMVTDPNLLLQELGVALLAAFRSAIAKIGK